MKSTDLYEWYKSAGYKSSYRDFLIIIRKHLE